MAALKRNSQFYPSIPTNQLTNVMQKCNLTCILKDAENNNNNKYRRRRRKKKKIVLTNAELYEEINNFYSTLTWFAIPFQQISPPAVVEMEKFTCLCY